MITLINLVLTWHHISFIVLLTIFPMLYFTSPWLVYNYQVVFLNPFPFSTHPNAPPILPTLDVDSIQRDPYVVDAANKFTRTKKSCGEKGMAWPLSQRQSASTLAWTDFYCFPIAYIKEGSHSLCSGLLRWLLFTDNKGKDVTDLLLTG